MVSSSDEFDSAPVVTTAAPGLEEPKAQSLLFHGLRQVINPFRHSWTLIRLGYEPLRPVHFYTPSALLGWSPPILIYPNILKYTYHTMKTLGVWNTLSAGFFANVCMDFTSALFYRALCRRSQQWAVWRCTPSSSGSFWSWTGPDEIHRKSMPTTNSAYAVERQMEEAGFPQFLNMLLDVLSIKVWEVVLTHPLYVIMVRQISALVGGDREYSWFPIALRSTYRETGLAGFFQGLAPRLFGEVLSLAVYYSTCRLISRLFFSADLHRAGGANRLSPVKDFARFALHLTVRHHAYPFELTSIIMMNRGTRLYSPREADSFTNWYSCYQLLRQSGQANRGRFPLIRSHVQQETLLEKNQSCASS